jgi:ferredoxin
LRSLSAAEFTEGGNDVKRIIHRVVRDLETEGVKATGIFCFPMEMGRSDGLPFVASLRPLAEAAGLGVMGKSRLLLHPRFGADIYIGAIALEHPVSTYGEPLRSSPCLDCNLCDETCPTGAIAHDGHFDFGSCMTHNYREKVGGFVEWIHTLADSRNRQDYRRRVSDTETLSWWQSLGYDANTHCDYCMAVCPAGSEALAFQTHRKNHFDEVVAPLQERRENVYVVPGSDAEVHVAEAFPHKSIRRIGSGRSVDSIAGLLRMLPLTFQRGRSQGVAALFHFQFHGREVAEASIDIRNQHISVEPGLIGKPDLRVIADSDAWLGFLAKDRNLAWELLRRRIRIKGPRRLLQDFGKCFPS